MKLHPAFGLLAAVSLLAPFCNAAEPASPAATSASSSTNWTAAQDHKNMMDQLGIARLRPGPSGRRGATNEANYDESRANPFPNLPDPLIAKNGQKISTTDAWWKQRRPEI